ncbi:MAG: hypothetical protein R3A13_12940 [Bdellovibrionota bacterium]
MVRAVSGLAATPAADVAAPRASVSSPDRSTVPDGLDSSSLRLVRPASSHSEILAKASNQVAVLKGIARGELQGRVGISLADILRDPELHPTLKYESARLVSIHGLLIEHDSWQAVSVNEKWLQAVTNTLANTGEFFTAAFCAMSLQKALEDVSLRHYFGSEAVGKCPAESKEAVKQLTEAVKEIFESRWNNSKNFRAKIVDRLYVDKLSELAISGQELNPEKVWQDLNDQSHLKTLLAFTTIVGQSLFDCDVVYDHTRGYKDLFKKKADPLNQIPVNEDQPGF